MAYFYVSSVIGTRTTGGGTTKQTGSFSALGAANVYASIPLAIADGASDADICCVSDSHAHSTTSTIAYTGGTTTFLNVVCVSDTACDTYSTGGSETTTGGAGDFNISGLLNISGIDLNTTDNFFSNTSGTNFIMNDGTLTIANPSNYIDLNAADNITFEFNDTIIDFAYNSAYVWVASGSRFIMRGGSFTSTISGNINDLFKGGFYLGGGSAFLSGVDLSVVDGYILGETGGTRTADDSIDVIVDKCKMHASVTFHEETFQNKSQRILVTQSSSSSAAAEYQYYFHTRGGVVEDATDKYRDNSTAFADSNQKVSLKCSTDSNAEIACPFVFDFPSTFAELATATTDTLRVYVLSATTLTDADVWKTAHYPDETNKQTFNTKISVTNPTDPLKTGTALTANTDSWTGRTTENRYRIDVDTSSDIGADCVPRLTVSVAKTSAFIYFDTTVDVVA